MRTRRGRPLTGSSAAARALRRDRKVTFDDKTIFQSRCVRNLGFWREERRRFLLAGQRFYALVVIKQGPQRGGGIQREYDNEPFHFELTQRDTPNKI